MIESNINRNLENKIDLYVNGKLTADEINDLWVELIQDEYYLDYTKSLANIRAVIQQEKKSKQYPMYRLRKVASYGVAAAIAIIIGIVGVLNFNIDNTELNSFDAVNWIEYDTYRSSNNDNPAIIGNELIKAAIKLANDGYAKEAIEMLEKELLTETDNATIAELLLSLGSIQYNHGDYSNALINFKRVISIQDIEFQMLEKGFWYLANTQIQLDDLADAEISLQKTLSMNGQYSRVAERYLNAINNLD